MMLNFFLLCCGAPEPQDEFRRAALAWIGEAIPFLVAGSAVLAMLLSITLRYNDRVRAWWEANVCGWMEEHVVKSEETKGGR